MTTSTLASAAAPVAPPRARSAGDGPVVLALLLAWLALWLLLDPLGNFPVLDDWAYAFAARSIVETGRFALTGFTAPNLIVQAYWGALFCLPFGFSFTALRLSTAVLALVGVFAAYKLLREVGADRATAAIGALTLGANPLYLQWSASFMTDVPFTALVTLSFYLYVRGARRGDASAIVAAYAVALVALFIRQFGLILPVAFGVAEITRRGLRPGPIAAAILPVLLFAAAHSLFQHWVLTTGRTPRFAEALGGLSHIDWAERLPWVRNYTLSMLPYFGLFVLPFLPVLLLRRPRLGAGMWRPAMFWPLSLVLGAGLFLVLLWRTDLLPTFGNCLTVYGLGPMPLFDTLYKLRNIPKLPGADTFWTVMTVFGVWGTVVIGLCALRVLLRLLAGLRRPSSWAPDWPLAMMLTFIAGYTAAIVAAMLLDLVFDRYLITLIPPLCVVLLLSLPPQGPLAAPRLALALAAVPLAVCAVLAVLAAHDYLAFTHTRWEATDALERSGVLPSSIDGGFEYGGIKLFNPFYQRQDGKSWWWVQNNEYLITVGPMPGYQIVREYPFPHWLPGADYAVHVLRRL